MDTAACAGAAEIMRQSVSAPCLHKRLSGIDYLLNAGCRHRMPACFQAAAMIYGKRGASCSDILVESDALAFIRKSEILEVDNRSDRETIVCLNRGNIAALDSGFGERTSGGLACRGKTHDRGAFGDAQRVARSLACGDAHPSGVFCRENACGSAVAYR